ncbi:MAG TPA: hypothetical protein V6C57_18835 [Coleofasciculaceae cyanobacterium]
MKTATQPAVNYFQSPEAQKFRDETRKSGLLVAFSNIWKAIATVDLDPRVCQERDRYGRSYWHVFDPITNQDQFFDTEDEVCVWLEQRYYA